jgi:Berberine and berberine like
MAGAEGAHLDAGTRRDGIGFTAGRQEPDQLSPPGGVLAAQPPAQLGGPAEGAARVTGSLQTRGGAIARIGEQDAAAGHRGARFEFMASTSWDDPGEDDTRRTSTRLYADQIAPYGRGVYVNNLGIEGEDRVRDAYGAEKFQRLTSLKARFDPDNVFHLNQNIHPAGRPR